MLEDEPTGGGQSGDVPARNAAETTTPDATTAATSTARAGNAPSVDGPAGHSQPGNALAGGESGAEEDTGAVAPARRRVTRRRTVAAEASADAPEAGPEPAATDDETPARRTRTRRKPVEPDGVGESGQPEAPARRTRSRRAAAPALDAPAADGVTGAAAPGGDAGETGAGTMSTGAGTVSTGAGTVSTGAGTVSTGAGTVSTGAGTVSTGRAQGAASAGGGSPTAGGSAADSAGSAAGGAVGSSPFAASAGGAARSGRPATADTPAGSVASGQPAAAQEKPKATGYDDDLAAQPSRSRRRATTATVLFMAPEATEPPEHPAAVAAETEAEEDEPVAEEPARPSRRRRSRAAAAVEPEPVAPAAELEEHDEADADEDESDEDDESGGSRRRRRRGRRGRGRGRGLGDESGESEGDEESAEAGEDEAEEDEPGDAGEPMTRRRRRRRRGGSSGEESTSEDGVVTVVKVRQPRLARDEVQGVSGSTRLEAKRQRRRDGREQRRTRPPILSESEFLARRESVDRTMVIRQKGDRTQIAVLEDKVLVEHYVTRASAGSMVGNVYLGKVQNVLPSMEAAFVDIGRGRNAVLYAGEVNWDATGLEGRGRAIEQALRSGDSVLVQVTKDPIGHKGARLTSHVALSGRHLVYVPHGNASGISRKLPDNERRRLRDVLKNLVPDGAGVIVRTAAEGAAEDELARDVTRLQAQWEDIQVKSADGGAPVLLYEEPDLVIRVVRDLFNEDFRELVIQGSEAYDVVEMYLKHVSPDLLERLHRHTSAGDVFVERRIDEQILKGLDRKVFLPSGGTLVIDRTEAMTVIDVNTGKYTGTGGNLEETVTRNNLEAAEEIVRQLRLRDLGGIIVVDFIDMVLESNRELVLRRLTECLGRDRTKHQVTEITSLGLVQMTRKRIGQGLLEAFSETCEVCKGRGLIIHTEPVSERKPAAKATAAVAAGHAGESSSGTTASARRRARRGARGVTDDTIAGTDDESVEHDIEGESEPDSEADTDAMLPGAEGWTGDEPSLVNGESDEAGDSEDGDDLEEDGAPNGSRRRGRRGGRRRTR